MIPTPKVDWLALAPTLSLLAASGVALLGSVLTPSWMRRWFTALVTFAGFITAGVFAAVADERRGHPVLRSYTARFSQLPMPNLQTPK